MTLAQAISNNEIDFSSPELQQFVLDPLRFKQLCWPNINFYDRQLEIVYSVRDNDETVVPAGNDLGKDFIAAFIALWFFCSRSPCKVITTSVDQSQLKGVLWGEMRRFIMTSQVPLPIVQNDLLLRQDLGGYTEPLSYLMGRVAKKGEGLLGHHVARLADNIPKTLAIFDEASGIDDTNYHTVDTWAHRKLIIGNPYPCDNFFKRNTKSGNHVAKDGKRVYRNVIKIRGQDSPNVRLAEMEIEKGHEPSHRNIIPGVLSYAEYIKRLEVWDKIRQCIGLEAEFYEGEETFLCPQEWMDRAIKIWRREQNQLKHLGRNSLGIDPAEGGDNTAWSVTNRRALLHQRVEKTMDTSVISGITLGLMREYNIPADRVYFDRGGGGKQIADYMRKQGHKVRTVGFGESPTDHSAEKYHTTKQDRKDRAEQQYIYKNMRAEMYHRVRLLIDPSLHPEDGFAIGDEYSELHRQLRCIPLLYDPEGRLYLPPKSKRNRESSEVTLEDLVGHSPDEADSFVLSLHGQFDLRKAVKAGAF